MVFKMFQLKQIVREAFERAKLSLLLTNFTVPGKSPKNEELKEVKHLVKSSMTRLSVVSILSAMKCLTH